MRKGRDGEKKTEKKKREKKKKENTDENSGHYVVASSRPPERRLLERRTLAPKLCCRDLDNQMVCASCVNSNPINLFPCMSLV